MKKTVFFALFICFYCINVWAYDIRLNNTQSIEEVKEAILSKINDICRDERITKLDAQTRKIQIASEFEEKFEDYKDRLRLLSDEIILLSDLKQNLKEIEYLENRKSSIRKELATKIDIFLRNNTDVYIPAVYASFIEMPIDQESQSDNMLTAGLQLLLIDRYGIGKLFSLTKTLNSKVIEDVIKSEKLGAVEQDGIRNFDGRDLIDRTPRMTKYLTTSFYRFKPFANKVAVQKTTSLLDRERTYRTKFWDLSESIEIDELENFIRNEFSDQAKLYVNNLRHYIRSLGNINDKIHNAQIRISRVLNKVEHFNLGHQKKNDVLQGTIESVKNENEQIKKYLNLRPNITEQEIETLKLRKQAKKQLFEEGFAYKFVLMEEFYSRDVRTALQHAIVEIFTKLDTMVKRQSVNIETIVSMGNLQKWEQSASTFVPSFSDAYVQQYVEGGDTGVLLSLTVKYNQGVSLPPLPPPPPLEYIENAMNLNIMMIGINNPDQNTSFFISETEITKWQFELFANDVGRPIEFFLANKACSRFMNDYPDDYPMYCLTAQGAQQFATWLSQKSGKEYRLPTNREWRYASNRGIYKGTGLRIVSETGGE